MKGRRHFEHADSMQLCCVLIVTSRRCVITRNTVRRSCLATYCVPVSSTAARQHLHSAVRHQLAHGRLHSIYCTDVHGWRYRLTASARMVVGLSQYCRPDDVELTANTPSSCGERHRCIWTITLRLICFLSTSVYSALGVSAIMRYINRRFTYLLTYLLSYSLVTRL